VAILGDPAPACQERNGTANSSFCLKHAENGRNRFVTTNPQPNPKLHERFITDSGVVGSRAFVESLFEQSRDRFGPKRKSGARKMRGKTAGAADLLWAERDLRVGVE
jgi:hypothetical protein